MPDTFTVALETSGSESLVVQSHGFTFTVAETGMSDGGHDRYRYAISQGDELICEGEDLRSGVQGSDVVEMFGALCSFLGAWQESRAYGRADSDNRDMFPASCAPVADAIGDGFAMLASDVAVEILKQRAAELGRDAGHAAGTWVFDGNTSTEHIRRVLKGIEGGDPMILDELPCAPLSGEYDGDMTPGQLMTEIDAADLRGMLGPDESGDIECEICDAYESAWQDAMIAEVERSGRAVL